MRDIFELPETAIGAFERVTGLAVVVHDPGGVMTPYLPAWRFLHQTAVCVAVKAQHEAACIAFDRDQVRLYLHQNPRGGLKLCHAGLVEWIVPIVRQGVVQAVVFAGQRLPGQALIVGGPAAGSRSAMPSLASGESPGPVAQDEAGALLELLTQLCVRLERWLDEVNEHFSGAPSEGLSSDRETRRHAIERFLDQRHRLPVGLPDLAAYLGVSVSRAAHAVPESCGRSFTDLLIERRLATAGSLLRYSDLSVMKIAAASGFEDASNFHRTFKARLGTTPSRFRRAERAGGRGQLPV